MAWIGVLAETRRAHENTKERKHGKGNVVGGRNDFEELSGRVIGAAISVHRVLGPGFLEQTYHTAFRVALDHRGIRHDVEFPVQLVFEGVSVGLARIDLVVDNSLVVELKAVEAFNPTHFAQLRSYLRATNLRVGLLINFNAPTLAIRRVVLD